MELSVPETDTGTGWGSYAVGAKVEVYLRDHGTWYPAQVKNYLSLPLPKNRDKMVVQFFPFNGPVQNSEEISIIAHKSQIRPSRCPSFDRNPELYEVVQAIYLGGWELAVIHDTSKSRFRGVVYTVWFPSSGKSRRLRLQEIRPHLQWVKPGKWIVPTIEEVQSTTYNKGDQVEIAFNAHGRIVGWRYAVIIKINRTNNLLVECCLSNSGCRELRRMLVPSKHVRPLQPAVQGVINFMKFDAVEAFYDDCWCPGYVSMFDGLHKGVVYNVISEFWKGEMEFAETKLRRRLNWEDGIWCSAQQIRKFPSNMLKERKRASKLMSKNWATTPAITSLTVGDTTKFTYTGACHVEVARLHRGEVVAWYEAYIVEIRGKNFLVVYFTRCNGDKRGMSEVINVKYVRPRPPLTYAFRDYEISDVIEGRYDGGWWPVSIIKISTGPDDRRIYKVQCMLWEESKDLPRRFLRQLECWEDGKWVQPKRSSCGTYLTIPMQLADKLSGQAPKGKEMVEDERSCQISKSPSFEAVEIYLCFVLFVNIVAILLPFMII